MKKQKHIPFAFFAVFVSLIAAVFGSVLFVRNAQAASNRQEIFSYLVNEMDLNSAAACGVMANIQMESNFNPHAVGDHGTSYGICQWHDSRYRRLKRYCKMRNLDYTTLKGQLAYMNYECRKSYSSTLCALKNVSDDAGGSYEAAYYWCYHYECPENYVAVAKIRGRLAQNTYWPAYGTLKLADTSLPVLSGANAPEVLKKGEKFVIRGKVTSESELTQVTVGVYNLGGDLLTGQSMSVSGKSCKLSRFQSSLQTASLSGGVYLYEVKATNAGGTEILLRQAFTVLASSNRYAEGVFKISRFKNKNISLISGEDGLVLKKNETSEAVYFDIINCGNGYYALGNLSSEKFLTAGGEDEDVTEEDWKGSSSQLWQILPADTNIYCLTPKSDTDCVLAVNGSRLTLEKRSLADEELWRFISAPSTESRLDFTLPKTKLTLTKKTYTVVYGCGSWELGAESNGTVRYETSDSSVLSVSSKGVVKAKACGIAEITVSATKSGCQTVTKTVKVTVQPKKTAFSSVRSAEKRTLMAAWKKNSQAGGYQLQVSLTKEFTKEKTKTVSITQPEVCSQSISGLASGRTYYVRVRACTKSGSVWVKGVWSAVKKVKVK